MLFDNCKHLVAFLNILDLMEIEAAMPANPGHKPSRS